MKQAIPANKNKEPDYETDNNGNVISEEKAAAPVNQVFSDDTELVQEMTGRFINKADLLQNEVELEITGLGTNQFGRKVLMVTYEGEERTLNISKTNYNDLIKMFGTKLSGWKNQKITVTGTEFEGDSSKDISNGVTLKIAKV